MNLEVTWLRATKVWWSFAWRAVVLGIIGNTAMGFLVGPILTAANLDPGMLQLTRMALGTLIGVPIGIFVFRSVLRMQFADFQISLVPVEQQGIVSE